MVNNSLQFVLEHDTNSKAQLSSRLKKSTFKSKLNSLKLYIDNANMVEGEASLIVGQK